MDYSRRKQKYEEEEEEGEAKPEIIRAKIHETRFSSQTESTLTSEHLLHFLPLLLCYRLPAAAESADLFLQTWRSFSFKHFEELLLWRLVLILQ